jgi:hypothetical protein
MQKELVNGLKALYLDIDHLLTEGYVLKTAFAGQIIANLINQSCIDIHQFADFLKIKGKGIAYALGSNSNKVLMSLETRGALNHEIYRLEAA